MRCDVNHDGKANPPGAMDAMMRRRVVVEGATDGGEEEGKEGARGAALGLGSSAAVDIRYECPVDVDEEECPPTWRNDVAVTEEWQALDDEEGRELVFIVGNKSSDLIVQVRDRSEARLFGECIIFAYMPENHFANTLAPLVTGAARAFPHVVFVGIEGRRSGIAPGNALPKAFPVLLHLNEEGKTSLYPGDHHDLLGLLKFVQDQTGESPITWNPPLYNFHVYPI
ncbi:Hypothetical Protein FCC1311_025102 [Hondaea fermentalgiana]|uniref:Uncharacterized protein n=1 Tax=Hondaea fermentalgiana TaxID=2315210 RepID=A0A2R5G7I3_9STRA|nr:Hypothetical Protein FCC1311_025102 [Hondaea fermentalgiana]|eukprot:GBG26289.1 Hypothetical Protein FCC1311_025102 [Hondaea fermentalgiana]